jgi:repressor LexA
VPDFSQLTERQREIYDFIREKIESRGYGPTVREIGLAFDIKSPNGVMCHLKALEKKGLIKRTGFQARAIQLVDHPRRGSSGIRLLGRVAAGTPMAAEEETDERLELGDLLGDPKNFALKVRGQSMIENHIDDGDYVIVHSQETAENGERVVAMVNDEVTLKFFYKDKDQIRLEPANKEMDTILVDPTDNIRILGKLLGVMRRC